METMMPKISIRKLKVGTQIIPLSNLEVIAAYMKILDLEQWKTVISDDCVIACPEDSLTDNSSLSNDLIALRRARENPLNIH